MPFWTWLIINIATFLLTELLRPKPQLEDAKPAGLGDFNVPTATEGRVVPIIWGRVKMAGPNVVWYGDLQADPITEKVKTGLFSSDTVTTGFRYSIGLQMALCRGPVDLLVNIRNDGSFCWGADAPSADTPVVPTDPGAPYFIDEPSFFGGEESGGGGGLVGGGRIFPGTETQAISAYLSTFQTPTPAYRGTCFVTWERGEIGLSPSLRAFEFELDRFPDGLDLATVQPGDEIIDLGANPMNVVFEVLTNDEWGLRRASSEVDIVNFRAVAAIMKAEGQGFAWLWDRSLDVLEVIKMVEQQVDGVLTQDPVSGLYTFKLIRFDYTPGALPLLDESNVKSVKSFQRPAWAETQNQVVVEFTDRRKNYTTSFALAQDMGNQDIVKTVNASKIRSPGVKNPTLANAIAWREIRTLSTPVPTMKIVTDRSQYALVPGDVREFSWGRFGITRLPIRITRVDRGQILKNEIILDVAQDVFAFNAGSFADPIDTGWLPVSSEAQPSLRERLWEVPFQLSLDNDRHLAVICSRDGGLHISFDVYSDRLDSPNFNLEGTELDFTPTALITAAISRDKGDVTPFVQDIEIDGINDVTVAELITAASTTIDATAPTNVFLIDEELFFFESVLDLGGGLVRLETCHAGLFDTVPADHADDSVVWFIGFGVGLLQRAGALPSPPGAIDVKILPNDPEYARHRLGRDLVDDGRPADQRPDPARRSDDKRRAVPRSRRLDARGRDARLHLEHAEPNDPGLRYEARRSGSPAKRRRRRPGRRPPGRHERRGRRLRPDLLGSVHNDELHPAIEPRDPRRARLPGRDLERDDRRRREPDRRDARLRGLRLRDQLRRRLRRRSAEQRDRPRCRRSAVHARAGPRIRPRSSLDDRLPRRGQHRRRSPLFTVFHRQPEQSVGPRRLVLYVRGQLPDARGYGRGVPGPGSELHRLPGRVDALHGRRDLQDPGRRAARGGGPPDRLLRLVRARLRRSDRPERPPQSDERPGLRRRRAERTE
jgi:hypothetical protein